MAAKRILLKGSEYCSFEEYVADAILSPGHLLERTATGAKKHAKRGGAFGGLVALEDAGLGNGIATAYAAADRVNTAVVPRGTIINARAAIGQDLSIGDLLISGGDGTVAAAPAQCRGVLYDNVARSAIITNVNAETAFDKSYAIPANFLRVGDVLHIRVAVLAILTNATDTLVLKLKLGATVVIATAAVDVADSDVGVIDVYFIVRTIGAAGTYVVSGEQALGVPGTVEMKPFYTPSAAIDTTATNTITASATWSVAHASNQVALDVLLVELTRTTADVIIGVAEAANDNSAGSAEAFGAVRIF